MQYAKINHGFIESLQSEPAEGLIEVPDSAIVGDYWDGTQIVVNPRFAWVKKDRIRDIVAGNPQEQFHRDIAAYYTTLVGDDVQKGWIWDGANWVEPAPEATPNPTVGAVEFLLLFTSQERVAIRAARSTDPVIDDLLTIVEDPRTTTIDLSRQSNIDAIDYLIAQGHVAADRRDAILSGTAM